MTPSSSQAFQTALYIHIYLNLSSAKFSSSLAEHKPEHLWQSFQQIIPARQKKKNHLFTPLGRKALYHINIDVPDYLNYDCKSAHLK